MIISRSPLRISFAGGGTDTPAFYIPYGPGFVVSTSINKYIYITLNKKFDGKVSVRYRIHENTNTVEDLKHPLIKEILKAYRIKNGIEIVIISDVPATGSGLGASSALAVALCAAARLYKNKYSSQFYDKTDEIDALLGSHDWKLSIAKIAADIEINKVNSPIGKQDHYASAIGGFNSIKFNSDGSVEVTPFESEDFIQEIESQSMLFYLNIEHTYYHQGAQRNLPDTSFTQKILYDQMVSMEKLKRSYELQRDNAIKLWECMTYEVPERFMDQVNENWRLKKSGHKDISSRYIDDIIQRAYSKGATAAKVCGAGGGGFLYLMVPPSMQNDVRAELDEFSELLFKFDKKGTEVIFDDTERFEHARV